MPNVTKTEVLSALNQAIEPESQKSVVTLNLIRDLELDGAKLSFTVMLPTPGYPHKSKIEDSIVEALRTVSQIKDVSVRFDENVSADPRLMSKMDIGVRNAIAVASGKGGVGKSTVASNLAISLSLDGANVGLLDADVYGPNIPIMMGLNERPKGQGNRIIPPQAHGIKLMSMGFLVDPKDAVIWRGPMIHNALRQFLQDVAWGELDYLVIDLPPGTGDASLSLAQSLGLTGAVIVTTPQKVALSDVVRGVGMFEQLNVPILGVVENMSYFEAPDTGTRYDIFGKGGGKMMAEEVGVEFLGEIPLEPQVRIGGDEGQPVVVSHPDSAAAKAIRSMARRVTLMVQARNLAATKESQSGPSLNIIS